jgi:hypothetical protein
MSLCAVRGLLWRQRACAPRTSFFASSLRRSSSGRNDGDDDDIAKARKAAALAELGSRQRKAEAKASEAAARAAEAAARAERAKAETAEAADRAKAEAAAHAAETAARAAEAAARAERAKAVSEAETAKATAGAAEAADRGNKVKAETAKIISDTRASENALWARRTVAGVLVGVLVFGASFLAYDHYTHHNRAYIRRRIREAFLAGPKEGLLPKPPSLSCPPLPLPPLPIEDMNVPLLVLGASGSGKSTQLGALARDFKAKGVPVIYFRFRAARELGPDGSPPRESEPQAPADLTVAARRFYEAVGYPERASIVSQWRVGGFGLSAGGVEVSAIREHVTSRFREAITDLFVVCTELYEERKADPTIAPSDRRPVVLSDELHDLLHDRYRNVGGKAVFAHFGNEMTVSDVDARVSRTILAASGADLLQELRTLSAARGNRVSPYMQPDPPESVVRERLAEVGYDPATVDAIMATCGTRVRLLAPFLESRHADALSRLRSIQFAAAGTVGALLARCPEEVDRQKLVRLLDKLAESPTSAEPLERFPAAVQKPFPNEALLMRVDREASFQTEAVREAWVRKRGLYVV